MMPIVPIFWIAYINVGVKRLMLLFGVEIAVFFAVWGHDLTRSLGYVIVGSFITLAFICVVAAYKYGIVIRRYSFMEYGKQYEIKDYYKPFHSLNNYRSLSTFNSNAIDSKIFLPNNRHGHILTISGLFYRHNLFQTMRPSCSWEGVGALLQKLLFNNIRPLTLM